MLDFQPEKEDRGKNSSPFRFSLHYPLGGGASLLKKENIDAKNRSSVGLTCLNMSICTRIRANSERRVQITGI